MIITRAKAEEAAKLLLLDLAETPTKESIKLAYHTQAKQAHPDAGGSAEAFARVDWAKHALLKWIKQSNGGEVPSIRANKCPACGGYGFVRKQRGFALGVRQHCHRCNGTGDGNYEHDRATPD